jgi:casein kinase II subunit alpha
MSLPKYYSQVCKSKPDDYTDYDHYQYKLGNHHNYEIQGQIGRGNYSEVFLGLDLSTNKQVIIKLLKPVKSSKIRREIKIL